MLSVSCSLASDPALTHTRAPDTAPPGQNSTNKLSNSSKPQSKAFRWHKVTLASGAGCKEVRAAGQSLCRAGPGLQSWQLWLWWQLCRAGGVGSVHHGLALSTRCSEGGFCRAGCWWGGQTHFVLPQEEPIFGAELELESASANSPELGLALETSSWPLGWGQHRAGCLHTARLPAAAWDLWQRRGVERGRGL